MPTIQSLGGASTNSGQTIGPALSHSTKLIINNADSANNQN